MAISSMVAPLADTLVAWVARSEWNECPSNPSAWRNLRTLKLLAPACNGLIIKSEDLGQFAIATMALF